MVLLDVSYNGALQISRTDLVFIIFNSIKSSFVQSETQTLVANTCMISNGAFVPARMPMPRIILFTHNKITNH